MKYYLVKLLTNTAGQDAPSIDVYDTKEKALVAYHNTLAAYHDAEDVKYAVVQIENEHGHCENLEVVDHRPEDVPEEPVVEPESED